MRTQKKCDIVSFFVIFTTLITTKKEVTHKPIPKRMACVKLCHNNKPYDVFTHISVVATFGDCAGKTFPIDDYSLRAMKLSIDHVDRNKHNNRIHNLEVVTHQQICMRRQLAPAYVPDLSLGY